MDILVTKISDITGEFGEQEIYDRLPAFRKKAADNCANKKDRERSLAAGALLLFCMKKQGVSLEEIPCFSKSGKMYFPQTDKFYVNLSHSGDYAACAMDTKEVGIDIEKIRQYQEKAAKRICLPEEMQTLFEGKKEEEKNRIFTKLWTRKESMAKLSGKGIAMFFDKRNDPVDCIYTKTYTSISDYYLSVSSYENDFPDKIILLSPESLVQLH